MALPWMDDLSDAELSAIMNQYEEEAEETDRVEEEDLPQSGRGRVSFTMRPSFENRAPRFGVRERVFDVRFQQHGTFDTRQRLTDAIVHGFRDALATLLMDPSLADRDRAFVHMASNRFNNNMGFHGATVGEWRRGGDRPEAILQQIQNMLNSNENFELDDSFTLAFTHVLATPVGSGKENKYVPGHQSFQRLKEMKQTIIAIKNKDNLCCAQAIVTAKAKVDGHPKWRSFQRGYPIQFDEAVRLHESVQVEPGPCGPEELKSFAASPLLQDYTIVVVDAHRSYTCFAYGQGPQLLGILYHEEHYDALTSLPGFFGRSYFCGHCFKAYNEQDHHLCRENVNLCKCCLQEGCSDHTAAITTRRDAAPGHVCPDCRRSFFGATCLTNHRTLRVDGRPATEDIPSVCQSRKKCATCFTLCRGVSEIASHRCGHATCRSCGRVVPLATHQCFLQVERPKKKRKTTPADVDDVDGETVDEDAAPSTLHVFFDIESMLGEQDVHVPMLLMAEHEESNDTVAFRGEECVQDFLKWLDGLALFYKKIIVLAHNFRGYDGYPTVRAYHERCQNIRQIRVGGKILQLVAENVTFIDSLSFFPIKLADFPKTFGITELAKGHFPHAFNTPDHQDYVGPLPALDYYLPDTLSPKDRRALETWHAEQVAADYEFDFQKDLEMYCESDVKLLKEGCLTFKADFQARCHFNPFEQPTIASACNRDLRRNRMQPRTIASEPLHGWRRSYRHSAVSMEWLHYVEHELRQAAWTALTPDEQDGWDQMALAYPDANDHPLYKQRLQHARHLGEFRVPGTPYVVDGYDRVTNTLYEFNGCFWHGCAVCHPNHRHEPHPILEGRSFQDVRRATETRKTALLAKGYRVVTMWECQWAALKTTDPTVGTFVDHLTLVPPLAPREAFKGGRTNAARLYHTVNHLQGEEIRYYDYTSLYPWVNKYCRYPLGHPVMYYDLPDTDLSPYFGLAQVTILPPRGLFHPVLPFTYGGKLTFPLCRTCALENVDRPLLTKVSSCSHTEDERCLTYTWCTPELDKAVEKGYIIQQIHEVWHFPETKVGLFKDYINTWLQLKQEASGWPDDVRTEQQKRDYITAYHEQEGILLEYDKVVKNPGLRTLAKLMLNSMWGKFGQRLDRLAVHEFTDPHAFSDFLASDEHDVRYVSPLNENRVEVHYKPKDEHILPDPNLNIFMSSLTTCWARLKLYDALDTLGERVLYYDTDSVIFTQLPDRPTVPLGNYLGEFTNELDPGDYITEFCSGGPKNYGYKTLTGKVCCKVRGFTLNSEGQTHLNYEVLRQNTLDEIQRPLREPRRTYVPQSHTIHRAVRTYGLFTRPTAKEYRLVYSKRALDPTTFITYPFGYSEEEEDPNLATLLSLMDSSEDEL